MLASAMLTSLSPISAVILADSSVADAYKTGSDSGVNKLPAVVSRLDTIKDNTIKGVDLTSYQAELSAGVKFYNFNHTELSGVSFMNFLKDNGITYVNLKVAVNPFDDQGHPYGQGVPNINNAIKTATLAKQAGLKVNVTLLYSDAYTSDDVQKLPKGWDSDVTKLNQQVKTYTDDVIKHFSDENIAPDMITVGNQINYKFLEKTDWPSITQLIKTITDDISNSLPDTKIAIGLGKPNQYWSTPIWQLNNAGIKYDTISANINPAWNSLTDIEAAKQEVIKANKKFTIGSVTYPFTDQDSDGKQNDTLASDVMSNGVGTVSPQGQATYIQKLTKLVTSDNNNDDAGVFYGDATWIAVKPGNTTNYQVNKDASNTFGTGWASQYAAGYIDGSDQYWGGNTQDNQALFDDQGNPLQSLTVFKQLSDDKNTEVTPDKDDNAAKQDPYEVGGDTGLKDQSVTINKIPSMTNQAIRGVDVSSYQSLKDAGVKFYDYDGKEAPLMKVLHDQGVNYIRIRIWNDPKDANGHYYGGGNNDVEQDLKIAKEANKYGMKLLLDFQYSDFWADPAQQILPKAWQGDNQAQLEQHVYDFTADTLKQFKAIGSDIGMVQIGNEITYGMMGQGLTRDNGGSYDAVWKDENKVNKIGGYLRSASRAVKKSSSGSLIAIHLETPDYNKYDSIMDALKKQNVDYDILGSSFYPFWSVNSKSNTISTLDSIQKLSEEKYGKLFAVLETSWVNSLNNGDSTPNSIGDDQNSWTNTNAYKVGPQGQVDELSAMYNNVLENSNGLGAFYWEPAWIPNVPGWKNGDRDKELADKYGSGWAASGAVGYFPDNKMYYNGKPAWGGSSWDNQALFDIQGHPLQSLKFYKDAGNQNKEQLTRLQFVDQNNTVIKTIFDKTLVGQQINITYPKIDGYVINDDKKSYTETASEDGIKTVIVKVSEANPATKPASEPEKNGFSMNQGQFVYYQNGKMIKGNKKIQNNWYSFSQKDGTLINIFYKKNNKNVSYTGYIHTPELSQANGGWNWIENGKPYTGFRYYMGTYYWFVNGVRQNAGWRTAWGYKYYTDSNGRAVQGIQVIGGKVYNFGNNGTYYLR